MSIFEIILFATFSTIIIVVYTYGYFSDKKIWNRGVCNKNGLPWECRDIASDGSRLYRAGEETCWICHNVDK